MTSSRFVRTDSNLFYLEGVETPLVPQPVAEVTHHVLVVDRSGSMAYDIEPLKQSLEQALAVESYKNGNVLTTVISFSSQGDVTLHWSKVAADKVVDLSEPYLKILRSIRATYLTGISQALNLALEQVDPNQTTGITLFTDGYANDPSPYVENKNLDAFVVKAGEHSGLFFNCIGYRDWCDWPRMNAMTNALSGKTVKAKSFKDVLDTISDTQKLLAGSVRPAIRIEAPSEGRALLAVNRTTGQVNFTYDNLVLRGTGSGDTIDLYCVRKAEATYNIPKGVKALGKEDAYLFGALALGYVATSELRAAKELIYASGNKTLWEEHQSAMTPSSIAFLNDDLQTWVRTGTNDAYEMGRNVRPKFNLFDLAAAINGLPPRSIGIDTDAFQKNYRRRSIKKIPGTREEDGTITPPRAESRTKGRTYIRGIDFNTTDASVQLGTEVSIDLIDASGTTLTEVAFVPLDKLKDYRSYTLVSSGERNVEMVPLEVYTKDAWDALSVYLRPSEGEAFVAGGGATLRMKQFRMEATDVPTPDEILTMVTRRIDATAHLKGYSAMQNKAEASPYSADQIAALNAVHLSPALYFSPPSTVHYSDREEAIRSGAIDSFTRYRVFFGQSDLLSEKELKSGNAFLARRYKVTNAAGEEDKKPSLAGYLLGDTYVVKPPGKGKDSAADRIQGAVFDEILLGETRLTNEKITSLLGETKRVIEDINRLLQPLVMEIGCTGLLPRDLESAFTRYEPDAFEKAFDQKLGKAEKEGLFFVAANGLVISVIPDVEWYTVKAD